MRDDDEAQVVREMAARLRSNHPALFGGPGVPSPTPHRQPPVAREPVETSPANSEPPLPSLSAVMRPIAQHVERVEALRLEAERRAADPIERQMERLGMLAPRMMAAEVLAVEEVLRLARVEGADGHADLAEMYLQEVVQVLDDVERQGDE